MKRLAAILAAVTVLVVGSAAVAMAAPMLDEQTPQAGWTCPGWTATFGNSDPATNPTIKRLADKLGMGADALSSELRAGKSVAEVANGKNVDVQVLVDTLIAPQKEMMAIRVKYGFITQEQADQAAQYMSDGIKAQLEQKGFFGGRGMMGGGMMGGGTMGPGMMGGGYGPGAGGIGAQRGLGGMMGGGPWNRTN